MTLADESGNPGWYVVYTKPRQEQTARQNLLRQYFKVWVPLLGKWIRRSAERICVSEPMFPRYLFLRTTQREQSLVSVRSTSRGAGALRRAIAHARRGGRDIAPAGRQNVRVAGCAKAGQPGTCLCVTC